VADAQITVPTENPVCSPDPLLFLLMKNKRVHHHPTKIKGASSSDFYFVSDFYC
jgi:hypothetical protein